MNLFLRLQKGMGVWCEAVFHATADAFVAFVGGGSCRPSIDDWHTAMCVPIPETVKYTKAVARIIGRPPPMYVAVAYNDAPPIFVSLASVLPSMEAAYLANASAEWRDEFWLFLRTLNSLAAGARDYKLPTAPTRGEIRENIDAHRRGAHAAAQPQAVTVSGAFDVALRAFVKELGVAKLSACIATEAGAVTAVSWSSMLSQAFEDASSDGNRQFMSTFAWPLLPADVADDVRAAFTEDVDLRVFVPLAQMNGFARVAKHIPSNVMDEIEGYTSKLLADVKSGAVNIRNLDLEKIGSAVLSKVSASDMSALSANLDGLLPLLDNASFKR